MASQQPRYCRIAQEGGVLTISIDRPEVLNALNPEAHAELAQAFDRYAADPDLRVAILTATGDRAFCVGSDLKARSKTNQDQHPATGFGGLTRRFDLDKPVICAVNGLAIGGGVELMLACDLVVAADHAQFALPEPRVGLAALGGGGLQRLARQIPLKQAMELVLTGRRIDAQKALAIGLVNEVVPKVDLMTRTNAMAAELLEMAPLALQASKQVMMRSLAFPDLEAAMAATYPAAERMLASEDAVEGQRAFVEKRNPVWKGR